MQIAGKVALIAGGASGLGGAAAKRLDRAGARVRMTMAEVEVVTRQELYDLVWSEPTRR